MDVSEEQEPGTWTWTSAAPEHFSNTWGPELHLCTMYMSGSQEPVLFLDVSTPQDPELHLFMSGPQEPVLLLDVSTPHHGSLSCTWTVLDNRSLCWPWTF